MSADVIDFAEAMRRQAVIDNAPIEANSEQANETEQHALQDKKQAFTLLGASDLPQSEPMAWSWSSLWRVHVCKDIPTYDYAVHQARGEKWYGHRTKICPVVYVCLEG